MSDLLQKLNKGKCIGGGVLSLIHSKIIDTAGSARKLHAIYLRLMEGASRPFFGLMRSWLGHGLVDDALKDFMVKQMAFKSVEEEVAPAYLCWHDRFLLVPARTPSFLEPVAKSILDIGRYLHMLCACGATFERISVPEQLHTYTMEVSDYVVPLEELTHKYGALLLDFLIKHRSLKQHLKSLKLFYFFDRADFIELFIEFTADDLARPASDLPNTKVIDLFKLALIESSTNKESFSEFLRIIPYEVSNNRSFLLNKSLNFKSLLSNNLTPTILDVFSYEYQVKWPIKLVLDDSVILPNFGLISRHLFVCKY
ncbi:Gamma-tubulin complex component 2, partial [Cichlidogyrus casuarinus]